MITSPSSSSPNTFRQEKENVIARQRTHNGMPDVIFKALDYYGITAELCKYSIVGKFLRPCPQIDQIRSRFKEIISLKGLVRIGVFDNHHIFIDLFNEDDLFGSDGLLKSMECRCGCKNGLWTSNKRRFYLLHLHWCSCQVYPSICMIDTTLSNY